MIQELNHDGSYQDVVWVLVLVGKGNKVELQLETGVPAAAEWQPGFALGELHRETGYSWMMVEAILELEEIRNVSCRWGVVPESEVYIHVATLNSYMQNT